MDWDWKLLRAHYVRALRDAKARGLNQESVAAAAGLKQHYISKIKTTPTRHGPAAAIFIRAIAGLGRPVSEFFAELEGRAVPRQDVSRTSPDVDRDAHIIEAIIDALQRSQSTPRPRTKL